MESETRKQRTKTRNPKPRIRKPEAWNPKNRNPESRTRNPKPDTRNPEPETDSVPAGLSGEHADRDSDNRCKVRLDTPHCGLRRKQIAKYKQLPVWVSVGISFLPTVLTLEGHLDSSLDAYSNSHLVFRCVEEATRSQIVRVSYPTLEATQGQILSQSPTDATSGR